MDSICNGLYITQVEKKGEKMKKMKKLIKIFWIAGDVALAIIFLKALGGL